MKRSPTMFAVLVLGVGLAVAQESDPHMAESETCVWAAGPTPTDLANAAGFCNDLISEPGVVVTAYANETLLFLEFNYESAEYLLSHQLQGERLIRVWMNEWKDRTDSTAVTLYVMWGEVQLAKGHTTLLRGDVVDFRST